MCPEIEAVNQVTSLSPWPSLTPHTHTHTHTHLNATHTIGKLKKTNESRATKISQNLPIKMID